MFNRLVVKLLGLNSEQNADDSNSIMSCQSLPRYFNFSTKMQCGMNGLEFTNLNNSSVTNDALKLVLP